MKKSKSFVKLCQKYGVNPELIPEITSFEAACKAQNVSPKNLPLVGRLPARHRKRLIADYKLTIIAEALNGKNLPDYTTGEWDKYFPVFKVQADQKRPSGFGLSCGGYGRWPAASGVGVRLTFNNRDLAIFFGKHFLKLHIDHHLLT